MVLLVAWRPKALRRGMVVRDLLPLEVEMRQADRGGDRLPLRDKGHWTKPLRGRSAAGWFGDPPTDVLAGMSIVSDHKFDRAIAGGVNVKREIRAVQSELPQPLACTQLKVVPDLQHCLRPSDSTAYPKQSMPVYSSFVPCAQKLQPKLLLPAQIHHTGEGGTV